MLMVDAIFEKHMDLGFKTVKLITFYMHASIEVVNQKYIYNRLSLFLIIHFYNIERKGYLKSTAIRSTLFIHTKYSSYLFSYF